MPLKPSNKLKIAGNARCLFLFCLLQLAGLIGYSQIQTHNVSLDPLYEQTVATTISSGYSLTLGDPYHPETGAAGNPALLASNKRYFGQMQNFLFLNDDINLDENSRRNYLFYGNLKRHGFSFSYKSVNIRPVWIVIDIWNWARYERKDNYFKLNYSYAFRNGLSVGASIGYASNLFLPDEVRVERLPIIHGDVLFFDVGMKYASSFDLRNDWKFTYDFGLYINNLGGHPKYTIEEVLVGRPLPSTMRIAGQIGYTKTTDAYSYFSSIAGYEFSRMMVPNNTRLDATFPGSLFVSFTDDNSFRNEMADNIHSIYYSNTYIYRSVAYINLVGGYSSNADQRYINFGAGLGLYGFILRYSQAHDIDQNGTPDRAVSAGFRLTLDGDQLLRFR